MNILSRELKAARKEFLFWVLGLFVMIYAGIVKSTGMVGDEAGVAVLLSSFPKIVLAVFGLSEVNMATFDGFYVVLAGFVTILAAVYAVHLGNHAVSAEAVDKTYEFVFTKPRSRSYILTMKLLCGLLALTAFCLVQFLLSMAASASIPMAQDYTGLFALYSLANWLVGLLFFALGALFAALASHAEQGAKWGNNAVLLLFCVGVLYDTLDNAAFLRWLSPFRYFLNAEILAHQMGGAFIALCLVIFAIALFFTYRSFEKKDLSAV